MIWENLKMALSSIRAAKMRSFLTMLGIIIGIASVVSINSIGEGVKQAVKGEVSEFGTNLLQINPGQSMGDESAEDGGGFNIASAFGSSTLTEKDLETIQKIPEVEAAAPFSFVSGVVTAEGKTAKSSYIIATTPDLSRAIKTELEKGNFLSGARKDQAVLGYTVAESLFGNADVVGKKVSLRRKEFEIVGVTKKPKSDSLIGSAGGLNQAIFIPFEMGKEFSGGAAQINEIDVKVRESDKVASTKEKITQLLKENHGGTKDFTVLTAEEQLKAFDTILALLTTFIAAIASIALLVGGIGIMNIMLVSVSERTREIGIRKALGATRRMILTQFLIESATISLFGGLLGCLAAVGMSIGIGKVAKITPGFTTEMFVLATSISVLIGILFGIMPAFKAARKKPIDALRYE